MLNNYSDGGWYFGNLKNSTNGDDAWGIKLFCHHQNISTNLNPWLLIVFKQK